jgi:predicted kinase
MSHLHLFAGKPAAGKSTLAAELARAPGAILLGEDRLLAALHGHEMATLEDYVRFSGRLKSALEPHILDLLALDLTVVLDFPGNTPSQRAWMRRLIDAAGCSHTLHVLDTSETECKARLRARNGGDGHPFKLTEQQFDTVARHYAAPSTAEGFETLVHARVPATP